MSSSITEKASDLRANAASSIIRNELESREIARMIENFKIVSTTSEELDKELGKLNNIMTRILTFLDLVISSLAESSSAVSASIRPSNSAATITAVINAIDDAKKNMLNAKEKNQELKEDADFPKRRNAILFIKAELNNASININNALNQLHLLLLGDGNS